MSEDLDAAEVLMLAGRRRRGAVAAGESFPEFRSQISAAAIILAGW